MALRLLYYEMGSFNIGVGKKGVNCVALICISRHSEERMNKTTLGVVPD